MEEEIVVESPKRGRFASLGARFNRIAREDVLTEFKGEGSVKKMSTFVNSHGGSMRKHSQRSVVLHSFRDDSEGHPPGSQDRHF